MKHIKTFENVNDMIPGMMYTTKSNVYYIRTVGFINKNNTSYPITAILFNTKKEDMKNVSFIDDKITIIEYNNNFNMIPLNISIKNYIINNNIVKDTLDKLNNTANSYNGLSKKSINMCYKFYEELIEDDDINLIYQTDKYNL